MIRFYLPLAGLLVAMQAQAQRSPVLGVKSGLNASTYQGEGVPNPGYRFGAAVGLFVRLPLGRHVALQPELLYEQRGASTNLAVDGPYGYLSHFVVFRQQSRSRLRYLTLPVLARVQLGKAFAVAGPQVSYLLHAWERTTTLIDDPTTFELPVPVTETRRGTDNYHRWDVGGVVGAGYQVLPRLAVELRYAAAFTLLRQPPPELTYDTVFGPDRLEQARTSSWQAQVSYTLGGK